MTMDDVLFYNGRIFTQSERVIEGQANLFESMLVRNGKIVALGTREDMSIGDTSNVVVRDLEQRILLPGFTDGHIHLLLLGQSLRKLDLGDCQDTEDIRKTIKSYALANPHVPTILCRGWMHRMTPNGVHASMLDSIDPRPIFIDSSSLHSCWCSSAALQALEVQDMPDPAGGKIHRDEAGDPTGLIDEGAMMSIIWPYQAKSSPKDERMEAIRAAIDEYNAAGYTGVIDMAMDEEAWDALVSLASQEAGITIRVAAYWLIKPTVDYTENSRQVRRAAEMSKRYNSANNPDLKIVGVKLICDGVIDACTAYLSEPYGGSLGTSAPIWEKPYLEAVVKEADSCGLQVALHAIGDAMVTMAIDAIARHGTPGRRHRIEHLELTSPEDAKRLGEMNLTASIQPIHADPSVLTKWPALIGEDRCRRAFAYRDFADAGALMAIGSDSPTASWLPLKNLYVATTGKSSRKPGYGDGMKWNEGMQLGLLESIVAATAGSARSVFSEERFGSLAVGMLADFVIMDMALNGESLLEAEVNETWFAGRKIWSKSQPSG